MKWAGAVNTGGPAGVAGGLAGGLVCGAAMLDLGALPSVASIVRLDSEVVGFAVHMAIAAVVGGGLGVLVWHQRPSAGETVIWGLVYGTLWWFIGTLTLHPLFTGNPLAWDAVVVRGSFPALLGHILYGATSGLTIALIRSGGPRSWSVSRSTLVRGAIAGLLAVGVVAAILAAQGQLHAFVAASPQETRLLHWLTALLIGAFAGMGFAALYAGSYHGAGVGLIRGGMFGFLCWVVVPLSLLPALDGSGLPWRADEVRSVFATLPGYILFGSATALFFQWLEVVRGLFSDVLTAADSEGIGAEGLRALAVGVLAGLVGGMAYTGVMIQIGAFESVAGLARLDSAIAGFFVHLAVATVVGASYGLLFRRQSRDVGSALGWGASYGFMWWMIGSLTLSSVFLGVTPVWSAESAATAFPHLIGHLLYGATLGATFYWLETRHRPWWITRDQARATLLASRSEQLQTAAPALWALVAVIALTLPVLLGQAGEAAPLTIY